MFCKCAQKIFSVEADHVVGHHGAADPRDDEGVEKRVYMTTGHDEEIDVVEGEFMFIDRNKILGEEGPMTFYKALRLSCRTPVYMMTHMSRPRLHNVPPERP